MRMIPGKTKVKIELFKGITLADVLFGAFSITLISFIITSSIPGRLYISGVFAILIVFLFVRIDTEPNYVYVLHVLRHYGYRRRYGRGRSDESYFTDRPDPTDENVMKEMLMDEPGDEDGDADGEPHLSEKERKRLRKQEDKLLANKKVSAEEKAAIREKRRKRSEAGMKRIAEERDAGTRRRDIGEIMGFTGISNNLIEYNGDYFGAAIEIPPVEFRFFSPNRRNTSIEQGLGKVLRSINPGFSANIVKLERPVFYDDYLHREYDKLDRVKAAYEQGLLTEKELQARVEIIYDRIYELQSLCYDIALTRATPTMVQPGQSGLSKISNMKKAVRRLYQESGMRLNNMEFDQVQAFIGSQINGWDPLPKEGRGIPTNSLAAGYPWIYSSVSDVGGVHLGSSDGVPVFVDFFRRDSERLNSNMVIVGKSGSGKSYATKSLLSNLAADDSKIFILDPENEYTELANNLSGKFINVGNAQQGRLNPFQIITALDDDESDGQSVSGSYATHLQFLEEFFVQILPDCDKDALEYLNSLVDRMYRDKGITAETDLSRLRPTDYPIFDDLYDIILLEFQKTGNDYIRSMLRVLMNYIAKFSTGGRNANIWNGPSTVTTEENFIVFNFQSLLANRNMTIANAQMLLVLKYVDNEIIKNRDYNHKYHLNRKVIVVIDEAHVFIDTKYPTALDFMFQLAKRIRKYNGMQIVITQNIKDFVGSEEIARKSTAIINACQYSLIFSLAPNDMQDLCTLYEKAGGINESEQEQIVAAPRGQAFTVLGPTSRTMFKVEVPKGVEDLFSNPEFVSSYFTGEDGQKAWEDFVSESREKRRENGVAERLAALAQEEESAADLTAPRSTVTFVEMEEEEEPEEAPPAPSAPPLPPQPPQPPAALPKSAPRETAPLPQPAEEETVLLAGEELPELPKRRPPAPPEQAKSDAGVEKILADLADKFRYDAMKDEIRRAVRMEIESEMATRRAEAGISQPVQPEAAQPPEAAAGTPAAEAPQAEAPAPQAAPSVPQAAVESEPASLDIAALLAAQVQKLGEVSPIDTMEIYGEMCVEVTLEELARYNAQKK